MEFAPNDFSAIFSNLFTLLFALIVCGLPIFIWSYFACNLGEMGDEEFDGKWGEFYSGLALDKTRSRRYRVLFYPFWFVMRRLLFAFTVVAAEANLGLQFGSAFIFSLVNMAYIIEFKPFTDEKVYWVEMFNEGANLLLLYHTMSFTDLMLDDMDRYKLGWSFVTFFALFFVGHMALLVHTTATAAYRQRRQKKILRIKIETGVIEREERQREQLRRELSMIKEDDFESNHSEKDSNEKRK